jgi:hypothetical protein
LEKKNRFCPGIGKSRGIFSKAWKIFQRLFQGLEIDCAARFDFNPQEKNHEAAEKEMEYWSDGALE